MNNAQSPIFSALKKLDYAIGQLEEAVDAEQDAKKRQADMFQRLQEEQNKTPTLDKQQIIKTLEKSIKTIETVLKEAS